MTILISSTFVKFLWPFIHWSSIRDKSSSKPTQINSRAWFEPTFFQMVSIHLMKEQHVKFDFLNPLARWMRVHLSLLHHYRRLSETRLLQLLPGPVIAIVGNQAWPQFQKTIPRNKVWKLFMKLCGMLKPCAHLSLLGPGLKTPTQLSHHRPRRNWKRYQSPPYLTFSGVQEKWVAQTPIFTGLCLDFNRFLISRFAR
jgi:hypothetical protein